MTVSAPFAPCPAIHPARSRSHGNRSSSVSGVPPAILSMFAGGWKVSASAKIQPVRATTPSATVVLPLPETPMTTTCVVTSEHQAEEEGEDEADGADEGLHHRPGLERRLLVHAEEAPDEP